VSTCSIVIHSNTRREGRFTSMCSLKRTETQTSSLLKKRIWQL